MSLHYIYSDAPGSTIDITDRCRVPGTSGPILSVKEQAEEGAVPISSLIVDDPLGDIEFTGHRRLYIYEDTAPVDDQVIYNGFTANERVARGPNRVGAGRQWTLDLSDPDVLINRRIMNGTDANRPAETDLARIQALLTMTELNTVDDDTYVNVGASTVNMDAVDYRGQNVGAYIDDCRQASGKNAYILYMEALGQYGLWYDFASSTEYDSGCFLTTNEAQEVDGDTVFGYSVERTYLNRDPSRVASGVYLEWAGTPAIYVEDSDTIDAFAAIDWAAPSENVKSEAKATARANRYLHDAKTEHEIIHTVVTKVPRISVNKIKKGQLVQIKGEWMPGFVTYRTCRVLYRTVIEVSEDPTASFEIEMDLDPQPLVCPDATPEMSFPALSSDPANIPLPSGSHIYSDATGNLQYLRPGSGYPEIPTPYFKGVWHFPCYNCLGSGMDQSGNCVGDLMRIIVVGDGTLTIPMVMPINNPPIDGQLEARWQYRDPGGAIITVETQNAAIDGTFTFNISTDSEAHCVNWVDVYEVDETCGHAGFAYAGGATWVPA